MAKGSSCSKQKENDNGRKFGISRTEATSEWVGMNYTNIQQVWRGPYPLDEVQSQFCDCVVRR